MTDPTDQENKLKVGTDILHDPITLVLDLNSHCEIRSEEELFEDVHFALIWKTFAERTKPLNNRGGGGGGGVIHGDIRAELRTTTCTSVNVPEIGCVCILYTTTNH